MKKEGREFPLREVTFGVTIPKRFQNPGNSGYNYRRGKTGKEQSGCEQCFLPLSLSLLSLVVGRGATEKSEAGMGWVM